jgi:hypothetical protein
MARLDKRPVDPAKAVLIDQVARSCHALVAEAAADVSKEEAAMGLGVDEGPILGDR